MFEELPAAQARGRRDQSKSQRRGWPGAEQEILQPQSEEQLGDTSASFEGVPHTITTQIPTIGSAAMGSASADETPIGGASREP